MSERLSGPAEAERRAAEGIAAREAQQAVIDRDHDRALKMNEAFDTRVQKQVDADHTKALKMNEKLDTINDRYDSVEGRDFQEEADVAIFGSHGRTEGYVDEDGNPITEPILGKVDEIRDAAGIEAIRVGNTAHGKNKAERMAIADQKEAENNARADQYVEQVEALRAEGFELSQAKVIMDKREERQEREQRMFGNLVKHNMDKLGMSEEEAKTDAAGRVMESTIRNGDDEALLKRIMKAEGLMNMDEYNKFRYKRGNPDAGERKEFLEFKKLSVNEFKDRKDAQDRIDTEHGLANKENLQRDAKAAEERAAEIDAELADAEQEDEPTGIRGALAKARRGLKNLWYKAGAEFSAFKANPREYFTDDEKGKERTIVGLAAGAVALAGTAYVIYKSGSHDHVSESMPKGNGHGHAHQAGNELFNSGVDGSNGHEAAQNAAQHGAEQAQNAAQHGHEAAQQAAQHGAEHAQAMVINGQEIEMPKSFMLADGDTIWGHAADILSQNGNQPTDAQVQELTQHLLDINNISWDDARHLSSGTKILTS
ncbi:MAG: hypothetical protein U0524_03865 [Candidatus Saccharimonadales bacterium]